MATGISELTAAQLATIGKYADVQFIWDMSQSGNLLFSMPFTDVDGTARIHSPLYINLATLFELTQGANADAAPGDAERIAQETHDGSFTAVGALSAAQAKALKVPQVIFVDADPKSGTDLVFTLADEPKAWVIVFTSLFNVATGSLAGHEGFGQVGHGGKITRAELASVNRVTVNWVHSGPTNDLLYTVAGSKNMYIINLSQLIAANQIDSGSH